MNEIILPPSDLPVDVKVFGSKVTSYARSNDFPEALLSQPDHVMIKSINPADFDKKFNSLKPWTAEKPYFIDIDDRFLVAARLLVPMALSQHRPVDWIELMEPKSSEGTADYLGVEYAEFFYTNFDQARLMLERKKIDYDRRADQDHRWLNVRINDEGQEIRITDRMLAETIDSELETGRAKILN